LKRGGIDAEVIGKVVEAEKGIKLSLNDHDYDLPKFERDEIVRIFES
jgi:hypothetical protein